MLISTRTPKWYETARVPVCGRLPAWLFGPVEKFAASAFFQCAAALVRLDPRLVAISESAFLTAPDAACGAFVWHFLSVLLAEFHVKPAHANLRPMPCLALLKSVEREPPFSKRGDAGARFQAMPHNAHGTSPVSF